MSVNKQGVVLRLEDVSLSYKGRRDKRKQVNGSAPHQVLKLISLDLLEGESLGVIGINGCGKSSLLSVMANIFAPSSGQVSLSKGVTVSLLALGLGFNEHLSGKDNAYLAAILQGSSTTEAESYLETIKEFSELGESFYDPVKSYSSGMRARLAFTTALKTKVDVLLIDEILSVGDAHFREKAYEAMKSRIRGDQTVVLVSHSYEQIEQLCSRVIWIDNGQIAAEGAPHEVLAAYGQYIESIPV